MSSQQLKKLRDRGMESEFSRRVREGEEQAPTVTRCTLCPWIFEGAAIDGRAASLEHRKSEHPDRVVYRTRRGKSKPKKVSVQEEPVKHPSRNETMNNPTPDCAPPADVEEKPRATKVSPAVLPVLKGDGDMQSGLRRPGRPVKIDDAKARDLHAEHLAGVSVRELGRRYWKELGLKNPNSAGVTIMTSFRRCGLATARHPQQATQKPTVVKRVEPTPTPTTTVRQCDLLLAELREATEALAAAQVRQAHALAALVVATADALLDDRPAA